MSGNRQDMSDAPLSGIDNIQDPGDLKSAAAAFEGMLEDIGSEPPLDVQEAEALASAEPEDISGLNELDALPEQDTEPEPVEAEAEGEEPAQVDDPEAGEEYDDVDDSLYTVKVQGEEQQVTLDDLQKGYMLQSDYTLKTQALSQERQNFEAEIQAVAAERQQYQQLLGALEQQLQAGVEQEPDWAKLAQDDPVAYTRQKAAWDQKQAMLNAANQERQRVEQAQQEEMQRKAHLHAQQERDKLLAVMPELADPQEQVKFRDSITSYVSQYGMNAQDLMALNDHRAFLLIDKARRYDEMQAQGAKVQRKAKTKANKVVRPGSAKGKGVVRSRSLRQANDRLSRTGDVRDAAAVFENII